MYRRTALHLALNQNIKNLEIVKYLSGVKEVDVNKVDKDGDTPLHMACNLELYSGPKIIDFARVNLNLFSKNIPNLF